MAKNKKPQKEKIEDKSTEMLYRSYKKLLNEAGILMPKKLEARFAECRDEKNPEDLTQLILFEPVGAIGMTALASSLAEINYQHLRIIKLYGADVQNEGTRKICQYLETNTSVRLLELVDCNLQDLACEFLSNLLGPNDYNPIGIQGVINLSKGLSLNSVLTNLNLNFCQIGPEAGPALMQLVIFHKSSLTTLSLQGNNLQDEGILQLFFGLQIAKKLEQVNVSDNKFTEQVIDLFKKVVESNQIIRVYDLRYNAIFDDGGIKIKLLLEKTENPPQILLSERMEKKLFEEIQTLQKSGKGKKKGKKSARKKSERLRQILQQQFRFISNNQLYQSHIIENDNDNTIRTKAFQIEFNI